VLRCVRRFQEQKGQARFPKGSLTFCPLVITWAPAPAAAQAPRRWPRLAPPSDGADDRTDGAVPPPPWRVRASTGNRSRGCRLGVIVHHLAVTRTENRSKVSSPCPASFRTLGVTSYRKSAREVHGMRSASPVIQAGSECMPEASRRRIHASQIIGPPGCVGTAVDRIAQVARMAPEGHPGGRHLPSVARTTAGSVSSCGARCPPGAAVSRPN